MKSIHACQRCRGLGAVMCAAVMIAFAGRSSANPDDRDILSALVRDALATEMTPGAAVAVVQGGRIHFEDAAGIADLETGRPVDLETAFYIASTSKALTALAAASLAERGRLDLDAPLSRALPGARFHDGIAPDSIQVIDLLTHTHGIDGMGPVSLRVAFTGEYTNAQLLELLGAHRPARQGRAFQYSNLGYDLIGLILSPSVERGWTQVVEEEVLRPLGMISTTSHPGRIPADRIALPHEMGPHGPERVQLAKEDRNMGPAGGHFSTARDLAKLVIAELNEGRMDGVQAIPARAVARTQRLHALQDRDFAYYHRHGWGLGWDIGMYEGDTLLHRFGGFAGYRSHVSFMPRRGIGVVVLMNGGDAAAAVIDVVAAGIYDAVLERPDASERTASRLAQARSAREELHSAVAEDRAKRAARRQPLPRPRSDYAGRYTNPLFGTIELRAVPEGLEARFGAAKGEAEIYDAAKDQFRVELIGRAGVLTVRFPSDGAGPARAVDYLDATFERD